MMINKRLIGTVPESKRYIVRNVALQWFLLLANITMMAPSLRCWRLYTPEMSHCSG